MHSLIKTLGDSAFYTQGQKKFLSMHWLCFCLLLFFSLVLVSCSSSSTIKTPEQMSAPGILDQPNKSVNSSISRYVIQPGDNLDIRFYYSSHLNEKAVVRPDGYITMRLIQEVRVASLTVPELTKVLKEKYSAFLRKPEISVHVTSFSSQKVYMDGEVWRPGVVKLAAGMTILQAISSVGGLKSSGLDDEVILIRRNGLKKPFVLIVNVADALDGSDITQDIPLQPQDIVYVPKSAIANVNTWVDLYIRRNLPLGVSYTIPPP